MALLGLTRVCSQNKGGVKNIYIAEMASVTSMTLGTGILSYSTITMATGALFKKYEFEEDTAAFKPVIEANKGASKITTTLDVDLGKMDLTERNAVQELLDANNCGFVIIVELNNGSLYVMGYNETDLKTRPVRITAGNGDSKLEFMDPTSDVITFIAISSVRPTTYTGTVPIT